METQLPRAATTSSRPLQNRLLRCGRGPGERSRAPIVVKPGLAGKGTWSVDPGHPSRFKGRCGACRAPTGKICCVTTGGLDDLRDAVGAALREAATRAVMPRCRALKSGEVLAKGPDDLVTAADLEAEAMISARLRELRPGVPVLGEEASHDDQGLRDRVEREGAYWVVDPLDGTKNFVAGEASFGLMVGLVENGSTVAGWIYLPVTDALYDGYLGDRVRRNGEPVTRLVTSALLTGFALTRFAPPEVRTVVEGGIASFIPPPTKGRAARPRRTHTCLRVESTSASTGERRRGTTLRARSWSHSRADDRDGSTVLPTDPAMVGLGSSSLDAPTPGPRCATLCARRVGRCSGSIPAARRAAARAASGRPPRVRGRSSGSPNPGGWRRGA